MSARRVPVALIGAFVVVTVGPLALSLISLDPGRGFWVNFSVAVGFVALALLGLQFVLAARSVRTTTPFGIDVVLQFHREITGVIVVLALATRSCCSSGTTASSSC